MNKVWCIVMLFAMYGMVPLNAQTRLSGPIQGGTNFIADGNPYIVEKDIIIPPGKKVVIGKGCIFYFLPFSGIVVEGGLKVAGTIDEPVIFTSINDSPSTQTQTVQQLPNPFDWNGIYITAKAGEVELSNFMLSYSVYGVKSQKESFTIVNGVFRQNGQYHCTVNETVKQVADGIPFTYAMHAVIYDPNGAASGSVPVDTLRYHQGMMVKVNGNYGKLVNPGHSFIGWNSSFDGKGTDYAEGATFAMGVNDIHLYAKWGAQGTRGAMAITDNTQRFGVPVVPLLVGSAGLVCGGVSVYFLKEWLSGRDDYDATIATKVRERLSDEGKISSAVSIATGTLSIAAITTSVILYLHNKPVKGRVDVAPLFSPEKTGAIVTIGM